MSSDNNDSNGDNDDNPDKKPPTPGGAAMGGINLNNLRLSQDFVAHAGVKKRITTVPVRKPHKQEFVRVKGGEGNRLETAILELKDEGENYLVSPDLWTGLTGQIVPKVLLTVINRQNVLSLWPIRLPGEDGRLDPYNKSALEAAHQAEKVWVKLVANKSLGAYEMFEAEDNATEPQWPEISFEEVIRIAFRDRFITSMDHPILKKLRGAD